MATINVNGKRFNISSMLSPLQQQKEVAGSYAERTVLSTMIYDPEYASTWNNLIDLELFEKQCIRRWRQMALNNYVDFAIQNIICEMLTLDDQSAFPIDLDLSKTTFSEKIKKKLHECFDRVMKMLHFVNKPYQILQQWYIDGKCYFFLNRDKNGKDIISIEMLDPLRIINYIERKDPSDPASEFRRKYHYQDMTCQQVVLEIDERDILMVPSGIMDNMHRIYSSYLDKAYIPLNQLTNMEDAVLIYRIARAPERRVFYIDVGELSKTKAQEYMQEVIGNLRNTMEFDKETGTIAEKRKHMSILEDLFLARRCLDLKTKIKLLDGRDLELQKIIEEYESGKELWTYSCSPDGEIVPGLISWAGITRKNAKVLDIHLDNGEIITTTPDHKFILRNGNKVEAQNLSVGSSLMPINTTYRKIHKIKTKYQYVKSNKTNKWLATHNMVNEFFEGKRPEKKHITVHHKDYNPMNNNPNNLLRCTKEEHLQIHGLNATLIWEMEKKNGTYEEHCRKISEGLKGKKKTLEHIKNNSKAQKAFYLTENGQQAKELFKIKNQIDPRLKAGGSKGRSVVEKNRQEYKKTHTKEEYYNKYCKHFIIAGQKWNDLQVQRRIDFFKSFNFSEIESIIHKNFHRKLKESDIIELIKNKYSMEKFTKFDLIGIFKHNGYDHLTCYMSRTFGKKWKLHRKEYIEISNHKVVKIVERDDRIDTGTLTIDENHLYHDYHNFSLSSGVFVCNSGTNTTSVETLPGAGNLGEISDLSYFLQKLFRSLNVPFTRWNEGSGGSNALGRASEINRDELLFTKFIARLRIHFNILFYNLIKKINEVENIIDIDDLEDEFESINFIWNTTNMFFELKNLDILSERMAALERVMPYSGRFFSISWIRKNVLNQTDEEIREIEKEIESEKELMKSWSPGADDFTQETRDADHEALGFDPNNLDNSGEIEQDSAGDPMVNNFKKRSFGYGGSKQQVEPKWVDSDEKEGVMKMPPRVTVPPVLDIEKEDK